MSTLCGLKSRWTIPAAWAAASPRAAWKNASTISRQLRSLGEPGGQVLAVDQLHRDESRPSTAGVEHGDHVRVAQLGHRARLAQQPRLRVSIVGERGPQTLSATLRSSSVSCAADHAHPAGAELAVQPVLADLLACCSCRDPRRIDMSGIVSVAGLEPDGSGAQVC